MSDEVKILIVGALLAAGLLASLVAGRVRVPALVLFLGIGMLLGSDALGWIDFNDYGEARTIGTIALALILFEGGLTSGPSELRPVLRPAAALATVGTTITAAVCGAAAMLIFNLSLLEGLLLGAVLCSTDAAAIFALLRSSTLSRRLARTLEAESGLNDPVAVLLVLGFVTWLTEPHYGVVDMLVLLVRQLGIGLVVGLLVGRAAVWLFPRLHLGATGLYPVASLTTAAVAFGAAGSLHGSGFLAVYLAGIALASPKVPARRTLVAFHEGLGWVAQLTLFFVLGLLVFPSQLDEIAIRGTALALVLAFVARPLGVFVATLPFGFTVPERVVLGWAGLRGAVPVVLATFPVTAGVTGGVELFNVVFFAVVFSTILQGATFESVGRWLKVTTTEPSLPPPVVEAGNIRRLGADILEFTVRAGDAADGATVRDLGLPRDSLVNVIVRGEEAIAPRGDTVVRTGDRVYVLVPQRLVAEWEGLVDRWRKGPLGRVRPPRPAPRGYETVFSVWSWDAAREGDAGRPEQVRGREVIEQLRDRRDTPGGVWWLADGRYAVTGPISVIGSRTSVARWARRRIGDTDGDEKAWLRTVISALATDE